MSEFTLATKLFGKLKNAGIRYKFSNGVYNPEEITIIHRPNNPNCGEYGLALVRSIPDSEDSELAYEVNWTNVPSYVLTYYKINRVQGYQWSDDLVNDILQVEKELKSYSYVPFTELPTIKAVDVIFNDPATIIIWADGSKTVVKAENEKFDPEKGLAMAISKKVLGNKHDYYEVFKRYVGRYEKKQGKKAKNNK